MAASADDRRLDGNAAAGDLTQIFAFEVTTATAVCAGCGQSGPVGALLAYATAIGTVLRCPGCDAALIRIAHIPSGPWLDLSGLRALRVPATG